MKKDKICTRCKQLKDITEYYLRTDNNHVSSRCKTCTVEHKKEWYDLNKTRPEIRYKDLKSAAKRRKKYFDLTKEDYVKIVSNNCYYCDKSLLKHVGSGIDRKDNNMGYIKDNCLPCCTACNLGRNASFSSEEWKVMINALRLWRKTRDSNPILVREHFA